MQHRDKYDKAKQHCPIKLHSEGVQIMEAPWNALQIPFITYKINKQKADKKMPSQRPSSWNNLMKVSQ